MMAEAAAEAAAMRRRQTTRSSFCAATAGRSCRDPAMDTSSTWVVRPALSPSLATSLSPVPIGFPCNNLTLDLFVLCGILSTFAVLL